MFLHCIAYTSVLPSPREDKPNCTPAVHLTPRSNVTIKLLRSRCSVCRYELGSPANDAKERHRGHKKGVTVKALSIAVFANVNISVNIGGTVTFFWLVHFTTMTTILLEQQSDIYGFFSRKLVPRARLLSIKSEER